MKLPLEYSPAIFLIFVILFITAILTLYYWSRRHLYSFASQLPGPVVLPLVGNGLDFFCKKEDIFSTILKLTQPYPSPSKVWLGPSLVVFIKDPDQLQSILLSHKMSTKSYIYRFLEPFLGQGLFTSQGNVHKTHRKLLQPLFSQKVLEGYSHLFQKHAKKFVDNIKKHTDGPEFDILTYLHESAFEATMDIFLEDKNDHPIDYAEISQYVKRFYDIFFTRVTTFWLHPDFIYNKTMLFKEQSKMSQVATVMTQELMNTRVPAIFKRLENNGKITENDEIRTPSLLEMIIEMLFENSNCLTEQECIDHMITFVATSQDTQSSAIAFTLMMFGAYPEIQDKVLQEIKDVIGDRQELDLTDVSKLKYLEMCIKESMRLFPVAPFIFRDTTEEFKLGKLVIPKGVTLSLAIFSIHRDPNLWEKPTEYYPQHFNPEAVAKRHPYAFIPFSAGPRKCIAQQFSYTNMKIIISTILLKYKLECQYSAENIKLMNDISVRPIDGYMIKITER